MCASSSVASVCWVADHADRRGWAVQIVATAGLILLIFGLGRTGRATPAPNHRVSAVSCAWLTNERPGLDTDCLRSMRLLRTGALPASAARWAKSRGCGDAGGR